MRTKMLRTTVLGVVAGIALVGGGPVLAAQTTQQATQVQEPKYACSIVVPQNATDASVAGQAKITLAQAQQAAQSAAPGTLIGSGLDNENGCLVYSVEIRSADGKIHDVKVDAGTAKILHQDTGSRAGSEHEGTGEQENGAED